MCRAAALATIVLLVNVFVLQPTRAVSSVQNVIEKTPALDELLLEQIERFRQGMPCGFPQLGIPALAPFVWKQMRWDTGENFWLRFDGELRNGTTVGFDQFNVTSLQLHLLKLQLNFELLFPAVQTVGKYNAKGKLAGFIPFDRSGKFSLQLYALKVQGSVRFTIEGSRLNVQGMKITPTVRSSLAHFDKIMPLPWTNSLFDRTISDMIPHYMEENRNAIAARIEASLRPKLNAVLQKYDIRDILGKISQKDFRFTSCQEA